MRLSRVFRSSGLVGLLLGLAAAAADPIPGLPSMAPLSPKEELATFRLPKGFRAQLVASEPAVVDPVAMAFDENGNLYVAEMRGYPNAGVATGAIHSGKIKLLQDRDGDGVYESSTVFAEGLRFPNSVMPWNGGLLVTVAPEIIFLKDTDGDGKADVQRRLYGGFDLSNIQQLVNGLQWGLDNWVHGCVGSKGGTVTSLERPEAPSIELRSRHIRFHPDKPASLEATSGGGQFGLTCDDSQQWFTATNSQHLRHIVLPDHYLKRNPFLPVSSVILDIPDHGASCKVHRISPFEAWREERTRRRKESADAKKFPSTELIPGGYITSASGPVIYTADLFPDAYRGNSFVCDPANNLIHRDRLVRRGATFVAERADEGCEFLASTDTWFRPVNLVLGPDGAIYVADFYREAIETPLSLPDDLKAKMNLESRGRGRIWRIVPEGAASLVKPTLGKAGSEELARHLNDPNSWSRRMAQQLLVEKRDKSVVPALVEMSSKASTPQGRIHALWTLDGLSALPADSVSTALRDSSWQVREQALRLSEARLSSSPTLRKSVFELAKDQEPRVRHQLAFTLGETDDPAAAIALAAIAKRDYADPWTQVAILSSSRKSALPLLVELAGDPAFTTAAKPSALQFLSRLAGVVGASADDAGVGKALALLARTEGVGEEWKFVLLEGLGQGKQNSKRPLQLLWEDAAPGNSSTTSAAERLFQRAALVAQDPQAKLGERQKAARLLGYGPPRLVEASLRTILSPKQPAELQLAAVRALAMQDRPTTAQTLIAGWSNYSPTVRREVVEALFSQKGRIVAVLDAIEKKEISPSQIEPVRLDQLRKHPDRQIQARAKSVLRGLVAADRQKIIDDYRAALDLPARSEQGKNVFKMQCSTCHKLENVGTEVGPDLLSALRNKTKESLLADILDPSREVDPRYVQYVVETKEGKVLTGMLAAETASSVTLRRAERAEDTLLRDQIDAIQATAKSLMPEGLENQLKKQDFADLVAYLLEVARK